MDGNYPKGGDVIILDLEPEGTTPIFWVRTHARGSATPVFEGVDAWARARAAAQEMAGRSARSGTPQRWPFREARDRRASAALKLRSLRRFATRCLDRTATVRGCSRYTAHRGRVRSPLTRRRYPPPTGSVLVNQRWCARQDSNLRPTAPEAVALSS